MIPSPVENMIPVGTQVRYKEFTGVVKFVDPASGSMTICIKVFEDHSRDVCLCVSSNDLDQVIPMTGNHNRQ